MSRILVIDDDLLVSRTIQFWLAQHGYDVALAHGASDGIEALEREPFDLVIVDIFMPHMNGFDSVRMLLNEAPGIPLIAMSGYAFAEGHSPAPDFLRMALALGAARCMRKPFKPQDLVATIRDCLPEAKSCGASSTQPSSSKDWGA